MSNEPVDVGIETDGPDKLGEQQQTSEPNIHFRIKPHEITIYQRMVIFWRSSMVVGCGGLDITAASKGSGNKLVVALSLPKG